ncbi:hypothetical protein [Pedococcus sp. 5OH_020]|uniref:hypothetical protein n=1 Tax=Pedococcus sp. 5OH_020 TaxID=2989814 RepID=UPI0022E9EBB5|nr:hypothetical protein [Pedococcus sp. 5OH_020]
MVLSATPAELDQLPGGGGQLTLQHQRRPHLATARLSRTWSTWLLTGLTVASCLAGWEIVTLVLLITLVAVALSGRRSVVACVPSALVFVVVATIVAWSLVSVWGYGPFSSRTGAQVLLVAMTGASSLLSLSRRSSAQVRVASRSEAVVCLPALVLAGYSMAANVLLPLPAAAGWFLSSIDNTSHLLFASELRHVGSLSYDGYPYPLGWHALVATLMSASGAQTQGPAGLLASVRLTSVLVWGLYAVLVLAMSLCALHLARGLGLRDRAALGVGLLTGATMLTPSFFVFTMALGFQTTILLALVLVVAAQEGSRRASHWPAFLTGCAALVAVAHTWQMALPIAMVPWVTSGAALWRRGRPGVQRPGILATGAVAVLLAWSPMWAVLTQFGLGHASVPGAIAKPPVYWLTAGAIGAVVTLKGRKPQGLAWMLAGMAATSLVTGVLVAQVVHTSLGSYYPTKMTWHAAVLAVPLAWTAVAQVSDTLRARSGPAAGTWLTPRRALISGLAAMFAVLAALTPFLAAFGQGPRANGAILRAVTRPAAADAQVTWRLGVSPRGEVIARMLLDFYHVGTGRPRTPGAEFDVAQSCAVLTLSRRPAVLTAASQEDVSEHFSCARAVRAIDANR